MSLPVVEATTAEVHRRRIATHLGRQSTRATGAAVTTLVAAVIVATANAAGGSSPTLLLEIAAGAMAIALVSHYQTAALAILLTLPVQPLLLSLAFRLGAPAQAVRAAGALKEVITLGLLVAVLRAGSRQRRGVLDNWGIAFAALAAAYVALPVLGGAFQSDADLNVRLLAWRQDCLWVVLLLVVRRMQLTPGQRRTLVATVIGVSAVVAGCAFVEFAAPDTWNVLILKDFGYANFKSQVLHDPLPDPTSVISRVTQAGVPIVRVGSVFLDVLAAAFWIAMPVGLLLARVTGPRMRSRDGLLLFGLAAALVTTETRSVLLGAAVAIALLLRHNLPGRARLGLLSAVGLLLLVPIAAQTTLSQRAFAAGGGADTQAHTSALSNGFAALFQSPLGRGLGTAAGVGGRYGVSGQITTEDQYLAIGVELGLAAFILYAGLCLHILRELHKVQLGDDVLPLGVFAGAVTVLFAGLVLHVFVDFTVSLTFATLVGIALGARPTGGATE